MPRLVPRLRSAWPSPDVVRAGFRRSRFTRLRLDRFPRGVDNSHIDVALGPVLSRAATAYVNALMREEAQRLWKEKSTAFSAPALQGFSQVLKELHRAAVKEARAMNRLERIQLFQLAVLKLILGLIDGELAALRDELEDARNQPARQVSGQSLRLHHQAVILGRYAGHVRYRVARQVIGEVMRLEHAGMKALRKSILGLTWPVPEYVLTNPLLQLDGFGAPRDFARNYPMVLHDAGDAYQANRCVLQTFSTWLPGSVESKLPAKRSEQSVTPRSEQGTARGFHETERRLRELVGEMEINDCGGSWLDQPENAVALLGGTESEWPSPSRWYHPGIGRLQRQLNKQLGSRLAGAGLLRSVQASYVLSAIYPSLGLMEAEVLVYDYLRKEINRREALRRLDALDGVSDATAVLRRIDELRNDFSRSRSGGQQQVLARFAGDLLRLRRDLKLAWRGFVGMDSIRLLKGEHDVALSRANDLLQLFCREDAVTDAPGDVIGHVIIKIEVRGTTELTQRMRERNLSASAHFSRFFYEPLTRLVERFGAQKVTVEGESIMLSLLEHATGGDRAAVARACCLSADFLRQVVTLNAESGRLGLPSIELGIGIAFAEKAPTYLYDNVRKVTVSPAIGMAGVLAGSHPVLRRQCRAPDIRGLCVAAPVQGAGQDGVDGASLVRSNINAIELDGAAFARLNAEITVHRLKMVDKKGRGAVRIAAGVCTDLRGDSHWLVVRERAVRLWIGRQLLDAENEGRRFYEVLTDTRLIERIRERLPDQ